MATADSVKAKIQGLIDSSNETTGQNDTDLTSAVYRLKEGYGQGGDNYYDTFWDNYQTNGTRQNYNYAFAGRGWSDNCYNPKYPIHNITYGSNLFTTSGISDTLFPIDFTSLLSNATGVFSGCAYLETIRTLTVDEKTTFNSWFTSTTSLKNITFNGIIANSLTLQYSSKLTKESITSIINALSTETSGLTVTLSQAAVDTITEAEGSIMWWGELVDSRTNWTITLV